MKLSDKHLAVTGTKKGASPEQLKTLKTLFSTFRDRGYRFLHNGDCVGVDDQAAQIWNRLKGDVILHPPTNDSHRAFTAHYLSFEPRPYLIRDQHMVEQSKALVAVPYTNYEEVRSGTWTTVRYARKLYRPIYIIQLDGTVVSGGKVR